MINNLIYNPGHRAVHYNLMNLEWVGHDYVTGQITAIGNVMRGGNDTDEGLPFQMLGGDGEAARQSVNFGLGIAIGVHRVGPLLLNFRSEEHTSELQSLMRISYAVFCLKQK